MKKKLEKIAKEGNLRAYVAREMLDNMDSYSGTEKQQARSWFKDLESGGCSSGMVSGLIYYADTKEFFATYLDDIDEIVQEYQNDTGSNYVLEPAFYNDLAWFGFEETARKLAIELKIDY